jgi:hypothetical protein
MTAPVALSDKAGKVLDFSGMAIRCNQIQTDAGAVAVGAQAAVVVALTDSTGDSGTHNDTLADGLTATAPASITNYTAHASGAVAVTSNAATDLDTTAAALATLENEVTALRVTVAACVTDLGVQNQNDSDLAQKINELRTAMIDAGVMAAS